VGYVQIISKKLIRLYFNGKEGERAAILDPLYKNKQIRSDNNLIGIFFKDVNRLGKLGGNQTGNAVYRQSKARGKEKSKIGLLGVEGGLSRGGA